MSEDLPTQTDDPQRELLVSLVERGLDLLSSGQQVDIDELCAQAPELATAVAQALDLDGDAASLTRLARDADPLLHTTLSQRYRLDRLLGAGAMGAVYLATDTELKRPVAVKILHAHLFAHEPSAQRFARESETLASLDHPHIVTIHDRGETERGTRYVVMDALRGVPLSDILHRATELAEEEGTPRVFATTDWLTALPDIDDVPEHSFLRQCVRWAAELASALDAAHAVGALHRDVKPSNTMITASGAAVLLDFGLAKRVQDPDLTAAESPVGTPWYMAPEQITGRTETEAASDVYGLTASLYHLLALVPPFDGDTTQIFTRIPHEDPRPASQLHPGLPRDLEAILDHGLERDPKHRYATAAALERDLRAFLDHRPVSVRPLSRTARLWRRAKRRPARPIAIVASALALVLLPLLLWAWRQEGERRRDDELQDLMVQIPARLAIEGDPQQRLLVPLAERSDDVAMLDRILELDPDQVAVRLLRSALLVDRGQPGDRAHAVADLDHLATQHDSAYVRAVAARYRGAAPEERGAAAIDLAELGVGPQSPAEHFIAGFHELRARHLAGFAARALEHLDAAATTLLPARDLRLLALLAMGDAEPKKRQEHAERALAEARWLEGHYGRPTPRVLSVIGTALIQLQRYADAIAPLRQSLRLRPGRHGPLHNLGVALARTGAFEEAEESLLAARHVRPWLWNTHYHLAYLYCDRGEYDRAFAAAEAIDPESLRERAFMQPYLLGIVRLEEAIGFRGKGDVDRAVELAGAAVEFLDQALAAEPGGWASRVKANREVAKALGVGDLNRACTYYFLAAAGDPLNPARLANLQIILPSGGLDSTATQTLGIYLDRLRHSLAPAAIESTSK